MLPVLRMQTVQEDIVPRQTCKDIASAATYGSMWPV
jgi:hypothetical protein